MSWNFYYNIKKYFVADQMFYCLAFAFCNYLHLCIFNPFIYLFLVPMCSFLLADRWILTPYDKFFAILLNSSTLPMNAFIFIINTNMYVFTPPFYFVLFIFVCLFLPSFVDYYLICGELFSPSTFPPVITLKLISCLFNWEN